METIQKSSERPSIDLNSGKLSSGTNRKLSLGTNGTSQIGSGGNTSTKKLIKNFDYEIKPMICNPNEDLFDEVDVSEEDFNDD